MSGAGRRFVYRYSVKPSDLWQVRMYYAYASYLAVVNIICIVASIALIIALWRTSADWFKVVMLIFLSLFTVVQPLFIYITSARQIGESMDGLELVFDEYGLTIRTEGKSESHPWKDIVSITVRPTLVIVYTDASHGYILTNRVLKDTRKGLLEFAAEKRNKRSERR